MILEEFGAKGDWDGRQGTDNTKAIQEAINAAEHNGTHHVVLQHDTKGSAYAVMGTLRLPSNLTFECEANVKIIRCQNKRGANAATLRSKPNRTANIVLNNVWIDSSLGMEGSFCYFEDTSGLKIINSTFKNSGGGFSIWIKDSTDIHIENVIIDNPTVDKSEFNDDGLHLAGVQDVVIKNCAIRTWDDAIALGGLKDVSLEWHSIHISDCQCISRRARMIAINIQENTPVGAYNIIIDNIVGEFNSRAINIIAENPNVKVKDISISNIVCRGNAYSRDNANLPNIRLGQKFDAIYLSGAKTLDGSKNLKDITLKDIIVLEAPYGSVNIAQCENIRLIDVNIVNTFQKQLDFTIKESTNIFSQRSTVYYSENDITFSSLQSEKLKNLRTLQSLRNA